MTQTLPRVTEAYRMFAQEEKHKELSAASHLESMVLMANKRRCIDNKYPGTSMKYNNNFKKATNSSKNSVGGVSKNEKTRIQILLYTLIVRFLDTALTDALEFIDILPTLQVSKTKR